MSEIFSCNTSPECCDTVKELKKKLNILENKKAFDKKEGFIYPCQHNWLDWESYGFNPNEAKVVATDVFETAKGCKQWNCYCGKGCEPVKVKIIIREIKDE